MISCPKCGEAEELRGARLDDDRTEITCEACGHVWVRDLYRCEACGSSNVYDEKRPLYQKARGVQQSIIGYNTVKICGSCGHTDAVSSGSTSYRSEDA